MSGTDQRDQLDAATVAKVKATFTDELFDPNYVLQQEPLPVPDWAKDLTLRVCELTSWPVPAILWYKAEPGKLAGGWFNHRTRELVILSPGPEFRPADELTIVHELAHYVTNEDHTPKMYSVMMCFVELFALDRRLAYMQEMKYMPTAFSAGLRMMRNAINRTDRR